MEKIEIKDMVTLRQEAVRVALQSMCGLEIYSHFNELVINRAKDLADFIKGDADLPEYNSPTDSAKMWSDMLDKINVNRCEPTSLFWISADNDMKPALDTQVLVMCADSEYPLFGEYLGEDYWEVADADVIHYTKDGEVTVVAWMPIPEYKPSV